MGYHVRLLWNNVGVNTGNTRRLRLDQDQSKAFVQRWEQKCIGAPQELGNVAANPEKMAVPANVASFAGLLDRWPHGAIANEHEVHAAVTADDLFGDVYNEGMILLRVKSANVRNHPGAVGKSNPCFQLLPA
jgi:hypothetical protein